MSREIGVLGDRAQALAKLRDMPEWQALRNEVDVWRDRKTKALASRLLSTGIVDQRDIDFQRGFLKGMEWLLDSPELTEKALIQAIERTTARG